MRVARPKLLARRIVGLDAAGRAHEFRARFSADGRVRVHSIGLSVGLRSRGDYMLILDPAIAFQRVVRAVPETKAELRQIARDLFPFTDETTRYAIASEGGKVNCVAMPSVDLDRIMIDWPAASAILVAALDPSAIEAAIMFRLDHGTVADLLELANPLVGPAPLVAAGLAFTIALAAIGAAWSWQSHQSNEERQLRRELVALEAEAAPVIKQREAILRMAPALKAQAAFSNNPTAAEIAVLATLLARLPPDSSIERLEIRPDSIMLAGQGSGAPDWLKAPELPAADIKIDPLPKSVHFTARFGPVAAAAKTTERAP